MIVYFVTKNRVNYNFLEFLNVVSQQPLAIAIEASRPNESELELKLSYLLK